MTQSSTDSSLVERLRYRVNNPSSWDSFDQAASDEIAEAASRISTLERELEEARADTQRIAEKYDAEDKRFDIALTAAEAKVARMGEALKPFAEYAPFVRMFVEGRASQGGSPMLPTRHFKLADFERARSALQSEKDREGEDGR